MIRIFKHMLLCSTALLLSACARGQATIKELKFDRTEWDFGTIREVDGKVSHTFTFTNTGPVPFVIEEIQTSCGCTVPTYSRTPIKPGEKSTVTVTYDPYNRPGKFVKDLLICTDGRSRRQLIRIRGTVEERPRTVEDDYPFALGHGVRSDNILLGFRYVGLGTSVSRVINYFNTSDQEVALQLRPQTSSGFLAVDAPDTICAGCKGTITFTYQLDRTPRSYGTMSDVFTVSLNGTPSNNRFTATAIGTDDFSETDLGQAPRAQLDESFHNFEEIRRGQTYTHTFTLSNTGAQPLAIRRIVLRNGLETSLKEGTTVPPGGSIDFSVGLRTAAYNPGRLFETLSFIVNDPRKPLRDIRLTAIITE